VSRVDLVIDTTLNRSTRIQQLEAMFDVPAAAHQHLKWSGDFPHDAQPWQIGLIVGPSGSGKSTLLRHVFGEPQPLTWGTGSVVDDFDARLSIGDIADVCSAVGFNTIPAWMRPKHVLSNGEQFRVEIARRLLEAGSEPIVVDEFTSVVDRQVAKITSHAVQKFVRKREGMRFVAASCHHDIVEWLQPDWILEPATMTFSRRSLQRRPPVDCDVVRVRYEAWRLFAPYHYLTAELNKVARCFAITVGDSMASFAGILPFPHPTAKNIVRCSRLVTLPDFQGLGLAMALIDELGAAYRAVGKRLRTYPAHPALVRSFDRSPRWVMHKRPGTFQNRNRSTTRPMEWGGRPCAVFEYSGPAMDRGAATALLG